MEKIGSYLSKLWRVGENFGIGTKTPTEKLEVAGNVKATGFVFPIYSGTLTDGAPTDAELDTLIASTPAGKGAGWTCIVIDDAGTEVNYLVSSNGTSWIYTAAVKAV
jgi:hypothetical protein